ncbi:hypothetical protein ACGFZK_01160 [Streptomyces sp. NPDC048257]|uniref:hypothetical protein n=1 Tax=Streptomyces sp. NPDC048257 TaxID=3365526 RepID=UPI003723D7FD
MTLLSDQATAVRALVDSADPGAVWAVGGLEGPQAGSEAGHPADAAFDVGGLTAVLALWPALGSLVDEGALQLHTPLTVYGEPAAENAPAGTTAHHLLTHPGGTTALTRLAEHLSGGPLADLAATRVWRPLGMTGTHFADGTLRAPLADLVRFLRHLLAPADPADPADPVNPAGISRAWTAESLRIRTGELTPARGLLWQPAPHGVWTHHAPQDGGPALWISPRHHRWAVLLPASDAGALRHAFREAAFAPTAGGRGRTDIAALPSGPAPLA